MSALRDTVYAWYPECNYNTHAYTYIAVEVSNYSNGDVVNLELRLVRIDPVRGIREVVDRRYDTWIMRT